MKPSTFFHLALLALPFILTACPTPDDGSKPSVAVSSPASDAALTGTVSVQVDANDNQGVSRVAVYARARGSKKQGLDVGSAVSSPYVISWDTTGTPNGELELVAVAEDGAGNKGESVPVRIRVQNENAPSLNYLVAYSLPPKPVNTVPKSFTSSNAGILPQHTLGALEHLSLPSVAVQASALRPRNLQPRAEPVRTLALEWSWQAFNAIGSVSGADGYSVWLSNADLAGPYTRVLNQASSTAGTQKYSRDYPDARVGDVVFGAIKAVTNNRTTESGFSNADVAVFPRAQEAASPSDGTTVSDGRPTLTWTPTENVTGYLYFLYDKNPWDSTAKLLWGNSPRTTDQLSATYPADRAALTAGTYYWWVAGVAFDPLKKADAFSFSEPRKIIVP